MREIKFRGLRTDAKGWVYGYYVKPFNDCLIVTIDFDTKTPTYLQVIPESLAQFTGLKDKKGKEIYEGDIIQTVADNGTRLSKFTIIWSDSRCRFMKHREDDYFFDLETNQTMLEIIGSIHTTPELLNPHK